MIWIANRKAHIFSLPLSHHISAFILIRGAIHTKVVPNMVVVIVIPLILI